MTASERIREARTARKCEVCGATLTADEIARLNADIDFVEHNGHLIRSVETRNYMSLEVSSDYSDNEFTWTPESARMQRGGTVGS